MKKINITSVGHGKPEFHKDLSRYLKSVFSEIGITTDVTMDLQQANINLLFEGFWREYDEILTTKLKQKNCIKGLINTEILVGEKNLDSVFFTYNNYYLQKKMIKKKSIFFELKFIHYLWVIKEKLIFFINYMKKNFKIIYLLFYPIFFLLHKLSKSNYEVTHNETSFFSYFFNLSTHFKDIYYRTWKHFDNFDFVLNIGSETIQSEIFSKKKPYFFLPFVYTEDYSKHFEIHSRDESKKYDFTFTGALTDYRLKLLKKLQEETNLKIHYTDLVQDHQKRLEILSNSKFLLGLKQNDFQTFISVSRIYNSIITEIPILMEAESYFTPNYFHQFVYMESTKNLGNKMIEMINNYDFYKKDFKEKKLAYIDFSNIHKKNLKTFIKNL